MNKTRTHPGIIFLTLNLSFLSYPKRYEAWRVMELIMFHSFVTLSSRLYLFFSVKDIQNWKTFSKVFLLTVDKILPQCTIYCSEQALSNRLCSSLLLYDEATICFHVYDGIDKLQIWFILWSPATSHRRRLFVIWHRAEPLTKLKFIFNQRVFNVHFESCFMILLTKVKETATVFTAS